MNVHTLLNTATCTCSNGIPSCFYVQQLCKLTLKFDTLAYFVRYFACRVLLYSILSRSIRATPCPWGWYNRPRTMKPVSSTTLTIPRPTVTSTTCLCGHLMYSGTVRYPPSKVLLYKSSYAFNKSQVIWRKLHDYKDLDVRNSVLYLYWYAFYCTCIYTLYFVFTECQFGRQLCHHWWEDFSQQQLSVYHVPDRKYNICILV